MTTGMTKCNDHPFKFHKLCIIASVQLYNMKYMQIQDKNLIAQHRHNCANYYSAKAQLTTACSS